MVDRDGVLIAPLWITQGEDWDRVFPINDPVTGLPIDLSAWTIVGQIRLTTESATILYEWKSANNNVALGIDGKATIQVSAATSLLWSWVDNDAVYDVFLTNPSNKKMCMARGPVVVRQAVTR